MHQLQQITFAVTSMFSQTRVHLTEEIRSFPDPGGQMPQVFAVRKNSGQQILDISRSVPNKLRRSADFTDGDSAR